MRKVTYICARGFSNDLSTTEPEAINRNSMSQLIMCCEICHDSWDKNKTLLIVSEMFKKLHCIIIVEKNCCIEDLLREKY